MRVYLAGPMRGYPMWNFPAFDRAAADLRTWGYEVVSPHELDEDAGFDRRTTVLPPGFMEAAMRRDVAALLTVDAVVLLPDWSESSGTAFELRVAEMIGVPVYELADGGLADVEPESPLVEAHRLAHGIRHADYGHPVEDFGRTGRMWGAILGIPDVEPAKVGLCMAAVKISRECHRPKRDNLVDLAGYAETVAMVRDREARS